ncbi:50S ribosomal protein L3 [Candidatus Omnitrophota bacterium]
MKMGLLGKKLGMTQAFTEDGKFMSVTVIEAGPCTVLNVLENKVLLGFGKKKAKNIPGPEMGLYKRANAEPSAFVKELPFDISKDVSIGKKITVDIFQEKDFVDIAGTSIGKGFQGGVKRWGWAGGPKSHGGMHHRRVGSIGGSSFPSRVWKGLHLPGRMGNKRRTVQNLEVIKVYKEKNILLVKGAVPGSKNGYLEIKLAKKKPVVRPKAETKQNEKTDKK